MMADKRSVIIQMTGMNPDRVRYQWEPKSEVSADVVGDTLRFARRNPSRRDVIHIDWEHIEYDRDVERHPLHMLDE
jgi:hypothetical protein